MSKPGRKRVMSSSLWHRIINLNNKEAELSNHAIADSLIIAVGMVKRHITNVYGKWGCAVERRRLRGRRMWGCLIRSAPIRFQEREWMVPISNLLNILPALCYNEMHSP